MNPRLAILRACKRIISPWARFLLHQGVSYREFDDVVRAVFVDIATKEFGIRGRPTNASRVAVLTGLTRKQIKRIRDELDDTAVEEAASYNQASVVLGAWFVDEQYSDNQVPKVIPFEGQPTSFSELVRKYGRDIPPRAMLRELKRTRAVEELPDGSIKALSRVNVLSGVDTASVERHGIAIARFLSTAVYNLMRDADDSGRYERQAFGHVLSESDRTKFDALVQKRGDELLEELSDWLLGRRLSDTVSNNRPDPDDALLGAGVFLFSGSTKKRL